MINELKSELVWIEFMAIAIFYYIPLAFAYIVRLRKPPSFFSMVWKVVDKLKELVDNRKV